MHRGSFVRSTLYGTSCTPKHPASRRAKFTECDGAVLAPSHGMMVRRQRSLILVYLALASLAAAACADMSNSSGLTSRRYRKSTPAEGSAANHDDDETEGEDDTDVGNPNADSKPKAPSSPGTSSAQFSVSLAETTPTLGLGDALELTASITPKGNFSGAVELSVSGLPQGASATPTTVTVSGSSPVSAKLRIQTAVDTIVSAPGASSPMVVTAKAGSVTATANANLKIAPKLKLTIPVNVDALRAASVRYRDEWGDGLGANQKSLRTQQNNGIVVTVFNADSRPHIIHGNSGFAHGDTEAPIPPNSFEETNGAPRTRTLSVGANTSGYLHEGVNGEGASFRFRVIAAP